MRCRGFVTLAVSDAPYGRCVDFIVPPQAGRCAAGRGVRGPGLAAWVAEAAPDSTTEARTVVGHVSVLDLTEHEIVPSGEGPVKIMMLG